MGQSCCHSEGRSHAEVKVGAKYQQSWIVNGMDCPSCVKKLQTALESTKEIKAAAVGFSTKKLQVAYTCGVAESVGASIVSTVVRQLGFSLQSTGESSPIDNMANRQIKRKAAIYWSGIVVFVVIAAGLWTVNPSWSHVAFSVATLWGLYPVAKKAYYQARRGLLFGIETLMAIACIGALFLGDYSEAALVLILFRFGRIFGRVCCREGS